MPFIREFNKDEISCSLTHTRDGKKLIKIHPSKTKRIQIRGQLGDDEMKEPIVPLKEPGSHDGMSWHSYEDSPVKAPSMFVRIGDVATAEFFQEIDRKVPDEIERLGLGNEYKRDDYRPIFNMKEGQETGAVSIKMNTQGSDRQTPVAIHAIDNEDEDPRQGSLLELKPGRVDAMYIDIAFATIWKVKREWGTTIWANEIYYRPKATESMVIGKKSASGGVLRPLKSKPKDEVEEEPDQGEGEAEEEEAEVEEVEEEDVEEEEAEPSPEPKKRKSSSRRHKSSSSKRHRTEEDE